MLTEPYALNVPLVTGIVTYKVGEVENGAIVNLAWTLTESVLHEAAFAA